MSIMLIEDNIIHAKLIKRALEKGGYSNNIQLLEDGEKAINYLFVNCDERSLPQLILLDINLPKIKGTEILKQIKEDERLRKIPVVILTTSKSRTDMELCLKYNANSYVCKPLDFENLTNRIKDIAHYWLEINDTIED